MVTGKVVSDKTWREDTTVRSAFALSPVSSGDRQEDGVPTSPRETETPRQGLRVGSLGHDPTTLRGPGGPQKSRVVGTGSRLDLSSWSLRGLRGADDEGKDDWLEGPVRLLALLRSLEPVHTLSPVS